jgi:hypothetical protein
MNYLSGKLVPVMVGCPRTMLTRTDRLADAPARETRGVESLLGVLRESPQPVNIHVVGTCNDVALASCRDRQLFARKCAAVYVNAGSSTQDPVQCRKLEYNVGLNPVAYAAIFDLPCPVYWMPCFEEIDKATGPEGYASHYCLRHEDILPHLSPCLQNYFTGMYRAGQSPDREQGPRTWWLQTLLGPSDREMLHQQARQSRNMWCTAGFFHCAGLAVLRDGRIVAAAGAGQAAVCDFQPIRARCHDNGVIEWKHDPASTNRYIFHIRHLDSYASAMTVAILNESKEFATCKFLYLGHAPSSIADKHYTPTPQNIFDEAVRYLGDQLGVK